MRYAQLRFSCAVSAIAGGSVLATGAFVFGPATERWLGFGVGAAMLAMTVMAFAVRGRGAVQRALDGLMAPVAAWALVSARTIELAANGAQPNLVEWLGFSSGAAIAGLGALGLFMHEIALESDLEWAQERLAAHSTFKGLAEDGLGQDGEASEHDGTRVGEWHR